MKLTRIETGAVEEVEVPETLIALDTQEDEEGFVTAGTVATLGDPKWFQALQQWALAHGYMPPRENGNG